MPVLAVSRMVGSLANGDCHCNVRSQQLGQDTCPVLCTRPYLMSGTFTYALKRSMNLPGLFVGTVNAGSKFWHCGESLRLDCLGDVCITSEWIFIEWKRMISWTDPSWLWLNFYISSVTSPSMVILTWPGLVNSSIIRIYECERQSSHIVQVLKLFMQTSKDSVAANRFFYCHIAA